VCEKVTARNCNWSQWSSGHCCLCHLQRYAGFWNVLKYFHTVGWALGWHSA